LVADPDGEVLAVDHGDERLATAGTGDVLTGVIAAGLAAGADPLTAAASAAWIHAEAGRRAGSIGVLAGDVVDHVPAALAARWDLGR
jgi:NAD(P)H-hydrate epimerase